MTEALRSAPDQLLEDLLERRTAANARFFEAEAERIAQLCHRMAERFARGGRLVALGHSPAARSDARHVAVEFVHPVIVGKRALPAIALTPDGGKLGGSGHAAGGPRRHRDRVRGRRRCDRGGAGTRNRPRLPHDRVRSRRGRVGARAAEQRPVRRSGADRDALPPAVGAGARLLRASRAAPRPRCRAGARHGRLELPLSVPGRRRARSRGGPGGRRSFGRVEGGRGQPRSASRRSAIIGTSWSRRQARCERRSLRAESCSPSGTAARPPTRWMPSRTFARRAAGWGKIRAPRSTSPRTPRS